MSNSYLLAVVGTGAVGVTEGGGGLAGGTGRAGGPPGAAGLAGAAGAAAAGMLLLAVASCRRGQPPLDDDQYIHVSKCDSQAF